jgi:hypothetical protein
MPGHTATLSTAVKQIINYNFRITKIKRKHKHDVYKGQTKWARFKNTTCSRTFFQFHQAKTKELQCKASQMATKS